MPWVGVKDFSDVVGAIYDCALDPERWRDTLPRISALTSSPYGALAIHDNVQARSGRVFDHGFDETYLKLYFEKYEPMNPLAGAAQTLEVGEAATTSMLVDEGEFLESRFYNEFLRPFGIRDSVTTVVLRSDRRMAIMIANRREEQPLYDQNDVRLVRLLSPHVCRALTISDALDLRTLKSQALETTLDALSVGIFLVDAQRRIVHINRAGENQLESGKALRIHNHCLTPVDHDAQAALSAAVLSAGQSRLPTGVTIPLPVDSGAGYVATVLPLDRGERRALLAPFAAVAAVFVQDPRIAPLLPGEAFAKLYGLTAGELRVLLTLVPGLATKDAADMLGISEATAKTHLQRIFAKTGTSRQTELLHLFMKATAPVRES
jgi:DNA-binding CsgD family transcriptional regulator/PAS domain-containing protein